MPVLVGVDVGSLSPFFVIHFIPPIFQWRNDVDQIKLIGFVRNDENWENLQIKKK